jgi:tetratricopeptide (TPR) repeat protein
MAGVVILVALVVVGIAVILSKYQAERAERIRQEQKSALEEAYQENNPERMAELAKALLKSGDESPDMERVMYLEALALQRLDRDGEGEAWKRLLENYPDSAYAGEALLALARDAEERGAMSEAREYLDRLVESPASPPETAEARLMLARLSEQAGNDGIARKTYQEIVQDGRDPEAVRESKKALSELNRSLVFAAGANEFNDTYVVGLGDKLITIANDYDTTVDLLQILNPDVGIIREGQVLTVPKTGGVRIEVDRAAFLLSVFSERKGTEGRFMLAYPIGLPEGNERKTPGKYVVGQDKQVFPEKEDGVYGSLGSRYIELLLADTGQSNRVALHGTNAPDSIGRVADANSLRLTNEDIEEVYALARVGTPVTVK